MENEITKIPPEKDKGGAWVTFGTEQYKVAPLSFASIKALQERITAMKAVAGAPDAAQMEVILDVAHAALRRNYPSLTMEAVADMVDLSNFNQVFAATMNIAGFKPDTGAPSGEQ